MRRLATSRPLGEQSEPCLAAKRPTASDEVARGRLACSKRSDSGERCEVKKAMKSRGELGREVRFPLSPPPPLRLPRFYFFAPLFTSHRSALSERLEQARGRLVSLDGFPFAFRAKNGEWRDLHLGFWVSFASP